MQNSGSETNLIRKYLVHLSKSDLGWLVHFFQYLRITQDPDIFEIIEDVTTLSLECIYACTNRDMYEDAKKIHDAVSKLETEMATNYELLEELERELKCLKILNEYNVNVPLSFVNENKNNLDAIKSLLIKMSESLKNR